jgi:hypothetical protein
MFKWVLLAAASLAVALLPVAAQFQLKSSDVLERYDRFQGYTMHFGPEDKFLEVNGSPVFVDLAEIWEEFGVASRATGADCQLLFSEGPIPFNTCQVNCTGNPNGVWPASTLCNAVNYNFAPIDPAAPTPTDALCEYLSCNDNPPATVPEAGWMLWTYNRVRGGQAHLCAGLCGTCAPRAPSCSLPRPCPLAARRARWWSRPTAARRGMA